MFEPDADGVLLRMAPSPARRFVAMTLLVVFGALLIYLVFSDPPSLILSVALIAMGAAALWTAVRMQRSVPLVLTVDALSDAEGRVLARLADIRKVERGTFAIKPSNGFVLLLHTRNGRVWVPGQWWRLGKRVGVGGIFSGTEAKFMADLIAMRIAASN